MIIETNQGLLLLVKNSINITSTLVSKDSNDEAAQNCINARMKVSSCNLMLLDMSHYKKRIKLACDP